MNDSSILDDIRRKFVGTGEEHEALKRLCDSYLEAYERGYSQAQKEAESERLADDSATAYARLLSEIQPDQKSFLGWTDFNYASYNVNRIAKWLTAIGQRPENLRRLADAMEKPEIE